LSSTSAGALKAFLETQALGLPWFRNKAPHTKGDGTPQGYPMGIIQDNIANAPERTGDGTYKRTIEQVQIDIYEDALAESPTLAKNVIRALAGAKLATAPELVYRIELFGGPNRVAVPDAEPPLVRHTATINLRRKL